MSNKGIIVVVLIFVVAAGAAAALVPLGRSLSLLERYRVESAVKATLNDPESALFTNYRIARGQDRVKVCGYVNAKNARGGYVGSRLFYGVLRDGQFSLKLIDTGEKPKFWEEEVAADACGTWFPR